MDDEVSVKNYQEDLSDSCGLSKNEVIKLLYNQDQSVALVAPEKFKSPIWERFRVVYYKGKSHNRQHQPRYYQRRTPVSRSVIRESLVRDVIATDVLFAGSFSVSLSIHSLQYIFTAVSFFFTFSFSREWKTKV